MNNKTVKTTHSLGAKTLLFAIFPTVIILFGIIVYSAVRMFTEVRAEAESLLQNLAKQVATEIERSNSQAVQAAHLMALAQESGGLFGNRLESIELARRVLKESPEFTGAYFGYEPNADGNDADYLKRYYIVHRANQEERVRRYLIDQQIGPVHFHDNP